MSFKLEINNNNGKFLIDLHRNLSVDDMEQVVRVADAMLNSIQEETNNKAYGPLQENNSAMTVAGKTQTRLGEFPVDQINMGSFKEPDTGLRIKFLEFVNTDKIKVFREIRNRTGISLMGVKDIVYGNYPCPILPANVAMEILTFLKGLNIHAKAVDADATIALGSRVDGLVGVAKRSATA